jgi:hypothetical protein
MSWRSSVNFDGRPWAPLSTTLKISESIQPGQLRDSGIRGGQRGGQQSAFTGNRKGPSTNGRRSELHRWTPANIRGPHPDKLLIRGFGVRVPDGPPT